ncbi:MAG: RNA 2',3'-cyclic phosphodiesterase [Gemmataceae bacterium]|nr:RNA 2',3'-cyclic phosphodiesterase [Gemmataceae bacterium]MDW8242348.1 RNA 2',3'-cyclic phosphodiesterase [Thermogemmata sp.]
MPQTRTFIAVEVNTGVRNNTIRLQQTLAQVASGVKWTSPDTLHITLLFLGDVDDRLLPEVCRHVQAAAQTVSPFSFSVAGLGAFPTLHHPKILWAGIQQGAEQLQALHAVIAGRLVPVGLYRPEERPYTPHLTLGRLRPDTPRGQLVRELQKRINWEAGLTQVQEVVVFASVLDRQGPLHTPMFRASLAPQPASPPSSS